MSIAYSSPIISAKRASLGSRIANGLTILPFWDSRCGMSSKTAFGALAVTHEKKS